MTLQTRCRQGKVQIRPDSGMDLTQPLFFELAGVVAVAPRACANLIESMLFPCQQGCRCKPFHN